MVRILSSRSVLFTLSLLLFLVAANVDVRGVSAQNTSDIIFASGRTSGAASLEWTYVVADANTVVIGSDIGTGSACSVYLDGALVLTVPQNYTGSYEFTGDHAASHTVRVTGGNIFHYSVQGHNNFIDGRQPSGHWASGSSVIPPEWNGSLIVDSLRDFISTGLLRDVLVWIVALMLVVAAVNAIRKIAMGLGLPDDDEAGPVLGADLPSAGEVNYMGSGHKEVKRKSGSYNVD